MPTAAEHHHDRVRILVEKTALGNLADREGDNGERLNYVADK